MFNPLRYENTSMQKSSQTVDSNFSYDASCEVDCRYVTTEQLNQDITNENFDFTLFSLNIRSVNKNFDKLSQCLKISNHYFSIIGLTETQLKDKPGYFLNLPNFG